MRGITITTEAQEFKRQHKAPCHDCPWRKCSIPGWLGPLSAEEWVRAGHGDGRIDCHTRRQDGKEDHWQCAGASIYRANVVKRVDPPNLELPPSDKVFTFGEFLAHHSKGLFGNLKKQGAKA